jgi:hypothetical protein
MSTNDESNHSNAVKDPDERQTGDETMTGAQGSYLQTLCDEAGEEFDPSLTKAEASKRIESCGPKQAGASFTERVTMVHQLQLINQRTGGQAHQLSPRCWTRSK